MVTVREIVYMCMDHLKLVSDDTYFTEDHILFQISKWRAFLLKQKYSDVKKSIPTENTGQICLDLEISPVLKGGSCAGVHLKSKQKIPSIIMRANPRVYPIDYFQGEITFVHRNRMRYVGHNKYLKNIIYCSLGPDNYLYFKSNNPQHIYLEKVKMSAIFADLEGMLELACDSTGEQCDPLDLEFPLENALVPPLIEQVIKSLVGPKYSPDDNKNNAKDDQAEMNINPNK